MEMDNGIILHRETTACFTGHRPEKLPDSGSRHSTATRVIKSMLYACINGAVNDGYDTFITGMQRGIDLWAGEIVLSLMAGSNLRLICAIPYEGFGKEFTGVDRWTYERLLEAASAKVTLCPHYTKDCMALRNRFMVDNSSRLIAVADDPKSGTGQTLRYARSAKLDIRLIDLDELFRKNNTDVRDLDNFEAAKQGYKAVTFTSAARRRKQEAGDKAQDFDSVKADTPSALCKKQEAGNKVQDFDSIQADTPVALCKKQEAGDKVQDFDSVQADTPAALCKKQEARDTAQDFDSVKDDMLIAPRNKGVPSAEKLPSEMSESAAANRFGKPDTNITENSLVQMHGKGIAESPSDGTGKKNAGKLNKSVGKTSADMPKQFVGSSAKPLDSRDVGIYAETIPENAHRKQETPAADIEIDERYSAVNDSTLTLL